MLTRRALNRATLARQHLLDRTTGPADRLIRHLGGLQAQAPLAPYVGLWTRLTGFRPDELVALLTDRRAVRASAMRGTVHLLAADDFLAFRPLVQIVLERGWRSQAFGKHLAGVDLEPLLARARELVEARPRTRAELGGLLHERWPDLDRDSLSYTVSYLEPLVQVPPRGLWGATGPAALTTSRSWLGRPLDPAPRIDDLVRRYLGAFGPATVMDVQAWSGLTRLREVLDRLRPGLLVLRGEDGAELFDLPDAPRPDEGTPAPPRFLPEYDNLLLSHADRSRVNPTNRRVPLPPGHGATSGTLLTDGEWTATWKLTKATVTITPFAPLDEPEVAAEAESLLAFLLPGTAAGVAFA
jgi:hypothetical protein